jgi:hypothetical protein
MSPPPNPDPDQLSQILKDSAVSGLLGTLSMIARIILSTDKTSVGYVARRISLAFIVGFFASMAVRDYITSVSLQFAAVGAISYSAPEVCDFVAGYVKKNLKFNPFK